MNNQSLKKHAIVVALLLCAVSMAGCHKSDTSQSGIPGQTLTPAQTLAKQQALMNNPRVSPHMKEMVRKQIQQSSPNATH